MKILNDNICVWDNAMSKEWCDELIAMTDEKIKIADRLRERNDGEPNHVYAGVTFSENKKRIDTSFVMKSYGSMYEKQEELLICIEECLREMNHHYLQYTGYAHVPRIQWSEQITCKVQRTPPGGGFSEWHYEQGSGIGECARRWGVWMLYLNDVEKGGKTDFPVQGLSVTPKAGTMVIWPAAYTHPHRSAPDLEEWKYIVTGWLQYYIEGESLLPRGESRLR
jgi:hypothetical protein